MAVKLKVYVNEDDALLFWSIAAPIADCRGFAIARRKNGEPEEFLANRIGFENEQIAAEPDEQREEQAPSKPSSEWPFQRFSWTDHEVGTGDTVSRTWWRNRTRSAAMRPRRSRQTSAKAAHAASAPWTPGAS